MADRLLELRLLGELQIVYDGRAIDLPPSKKTRALIAYLAATGRPHRRDRLCDLLWEGPDDPRGELRWSLSKIRPLLDAGGTIRLQTDRTRVAFETRDVVVDLATVRHLLGDLPSASVETLKTAVGLFRSEFLDGLDLPACYRFQEWCLAEREAVSALRLAALSALVDRLGDSPEDALVHARALVAADPLLEAAHARVIRLLGRLGRRRDALAQYEQARTLLEREIGAPLSGVLEQARHFIGVAPLLRTVASPVTADAGSEAQAQWPKRSEVPFVGRVAERAQIDRLVSAAADGRTTPMLLITGEPGIGKSRLLDHLAERVTMVGGHCLRCRAFEAEAARAYGAWRDALGAIPIHAIPQDIRRDLALLRPELGLPPDASMDRASLSNAVGALLRQLGQRVPLAMIVDDLQWLDEASSALLHYGARTLTAPAAVLFACAARPGELADNPGAVRTLRALERDGRLLELRLGGLSAAETADLVRAVDPSIDAASVFDASDGNPLFALEIAKVRHEGQHGSGRSLQAVIAQQLSTLPQPARGLVPWASAIGRTFGPDLLARVSGLETPMLLAALEGLERRGIIRGAGADSYDFMHDLVRTAAYHEISQPRRKLMHRQIARALGAIVETDDDLAGDLARHAELAGDHGLAARACIIAGERSLRLFANIEAASLARRGRSHLDRLPDDPLRRELLISLFKIEVLAAAGPALRPLPQILDDLSRAVADAEEAGLHAVAATGYYLLSVLHQETGNIARAEDSTVRAAQAGCRADQGTHARQLANTARCLIELEAEIPRARALLGEAETLLGASGHAVCELQWGQALLQRWDGNTDAAAVRIERALVLAREAEDRWREYKCLTWLAMVEFERGHYDATRCRCRELLAVAEKLGESEGPFALGLDALARLASGSPEAIAELDHACASLRAVDDKTYLSYTLNAAAMLHLEAGRRDAAWNCAREAEAAACAMHRFGDMALAQAVLAGTGRDGGAAAETIARLLEETCQADRTNARTRSALHAAARTLGLAVPSTSSTQRRRRNTA